MGLLSKRIGANLHSMRDTISVDQISFSAKVPFDKGLVVIIAEIDIE